MLANEGQYLLDIFADEAGTIYTSTCTPGTEMSGDIIFDRDLFAVQTTSSREAYHIPFTGTCGQGLRLIFNEDSNGGQVLGMWRILTMAKNSLEGSVGLDFWTRKIPMLWPEEEGDYYDGESVHITRGDHWDVVGHELGHAIYDQANVGDSRGGEHYIDRCYNGTMALSEGWASYFSAWLSIDLADPDAKFQYMVPRRAPIQVENVPADVCTGQANEWRVTSFFWDIIDSHDDGEATNENFAAVWQALFNSHSRNSAAAARRLVEAGVVSQGTLEVLWQLSFGAPYTPEDENEIIDPELARLTSGS